jgi:hypothetical protein
MVRIGVTFLLQHPVLSRVFKGPLELSLDEGSSVIDAIELVDQEILKKAEKFPVKDYKSLLHMTYNPFTNSFYKQVAIQGYTTPGSFLNLRKNPKEPLPDGVTIVLVPEGPCISEWEEVADW